MFDTTLDDARWAQVQARDPDADGRFWCVVRTTRIYCRPSCPARPHRRNVSFHESLASARATGARACRRCDPDGAAALTDRIAAADWRGVAAELDTQGWALLPGLLSAAECREVADLYAAGSAGFRSHVVMQRHGFGQGEYRYFAYPLPDRVETLRSGLYPYLSPIANRWAERLQLATRFPDDHAGFLARCHAAGQRRSTPLLLQYGPGDWNALHQDLYGEHVFPLQVAILLSQPGEDFEGGEFTLVEQRPRQQSKPMVAPLKRGDAVVFAVNQRPHAGAKGDHRVALRHGVSRLRSGRRHTLGVIFHDAT